MATATIAQPVKTKSDGTGADRQRLMSVDALRGFDMFWITGAGSLVYALDRMSQTPTTTFLATQLKHVDWQGFHFYDLIYPLFVFIMGVSLAFSMGRAIEQEGRAYALKRIVRRSALLFLIGIFYNGGCTNPWPNVRLLGVLSLIAVTYFFAGLLFCFFKPRALAVISVGLLIGYWALLRFVPIRDIQLEKNHLAQLAEQAGDGQTAALFRYGDTENPSGVKDSPAWAAARRMFYATTKRVTGKFDKGLNLANHIDFEYLPGCKGETFFDPEGYLPNLPAIVTCLLGVFAGLLLTDQTASDMRKAGCLIGFGLGAVALGWLWNLQFPVIKKLWTSSYVLVSGGYSAILLGVFYLIVDVWQARRWCQPFVWLGMNSITIYLATNILGGGIAWRKIAARFVGGDVSAFLDDHLTKGFGDLSISIVGLALAFWFVHFLYRKKIFLRL